MWKYSWQEDSKRHRVKFIVTLLSHIILIRFFVHVEYGYIHLKCITLTFSQWLCNVDKIITLLLQMRKLSHWEISLGHASDYRTSEWWNLKTSQSSLFPACISHIGRVSPRKKRETVKEEKKKILFIWKKIPVATYIFKCFKNKMVGKTSNFHPMSQNIGFTKAAAVSLLYAFLSSNSALLRLSIW